MAYYFCNKSSIIDTRLGYIQASENIEVFKVKLSWIKSSRLLQRIAFSCLLLIEVLCNLLMNLHNINQLKECKVFYLS